VPPGGDRLHAEIWLPLTGVPVRRTLDMRFSTIHGSPPAVPADEASLPDTRGPYDRLAGRVVKRSVVPFLGAGFSYGAGDGTGFTSAPDAMPTALIDLLERIFSASASTGRPGAGTLDKTFGRAKDLKSLGQLAELATVLLGPRAVCETLTIARYADLRPLPSHRHLVHLVREGLIREIITTNYDTCLETAFRESLEDPAQAETRSAVITSLEAYRRRAAAHLLPGHLLLYKINGCAAEYAAERHSDEPGRARRAAERIILTERQLQNFRREQWAQDLLRDRARTRTLLFSGFGSEEPQIRHTVLTMMEEFEGDGRKELRPAEAMDLPNAPFLQEYNAALSFYQLQILVGFLDAHSYPPYDDEVLDTRINTLFRNVLCGEAGGPPLDAATFLRRLSGVVFRELVRQATDDDKDLALWLRWRTPAWRMWLPEPMHLLDGPTDDPTEPPWVLRDPADPDRFPLPLWRLLYTMRFPGRPSPPDYYLPLRDEPVLILVTLILLAHLGVPEPFDGDFVLSVPCPGHQGDDTGGSGAVMGRDRPQPLRVRLIEEVAVQAVRDSPPEPDRARLIRLIAVPSHRATHTEARWERPEPETNGIPGLWVGRVVVVSAADLVTEAGVPQRLPHVLGPCFAATRPEPAARLTFLSRSGGDA